jgi:hypothetical protein
MLLLWSRSLQFIDDVRFSAGLQGTSTKLAHSKTDLAKDGKLLGTNSETSARFHTSSFPRSCSSTTKTLLLISILVGLVQAQTPPRLQKHLLSLDLGFMPVNYGGNHPFEHHWKLAGGDPYQLGVEYLDR